MCIGMMVYPIRYACGMLCIYLCLSKCKSPWIKRQLDSCVPICVYTRSLLFYHLQIRDDEVKCYGAACVSR